MYRPQFAYDTPPGFVDRDFVYCFDSKTVPLLNNTALAASGLVLNIPLPTQSDCPFFWRGTMIRGANVDFPVPVSVQFRDPFNNYQSDDFVPIGLYRFPTGLPQWGFNPVSQEPGLAVPKGAVFFLSIKNGTAVNQNLTKLRISIHGVKRLPEVARDC